MSTYEIKSWEIGYDDGVNARNYNAGKLNERQYRKGWEAGDTEISRSAGYITAELLRAREMLAQAHIWRDYIRTGERMDRRAQAWD